MNISKFANKQIHRLMLCDRPRQEAYRQAILSNAKLIAGKTVLDVGAGTGILSVFCAQAGAAKVYAVEASNIAKIARENVQRNGYENVIHVHQTKIENFQLNGDDQRQIDIIVSEWMGFYLLHEGMLDSVLFARDKFLKESGSMFPENATIYVSPCRLPAFFETWDTYDGVNLDAFAAALRAQKSMKPEIMVVPSSDLLHDGSVIAWYDLNTVTTEDLNEVDFSEVIVAQKDGRYQGVCIWFDVCFPENDAGDVVTLSTAPTAEPTHWKQTVILLPDQQQEDIEQNDAIALKVSMKRSGDESLRRYYLEVYILDPNDVEHSVPCACSLTKCILIKKQIELYEE